MSRSIRSLFCSRLLTVARILCGHRHHTLGRRYQQRVQVKLSPVSFHLYHHLCPCVLKSSTANQKENKSDSMGMRLDHLRLKNRSTLNPSQLMLQFTFKHERICLKQADCTSVMSRALCVCASPQRLDQKQTKVYINVWRRSDHSGAEHTATIWGSKFMLTSHPVRLLKILKVTADSFFYSSETQQHMTVF